MKESESHWQEDPEYPVEDWQYDVSNDDTRESYAEWVKNKRAAANARAWREEIPDSFCKAGHHFEVHTVGGLADALKALPRDLPMDSEQTVPVVYNVDSNRPFFALSDRDEYHQEHMADV